MFYNLTRVAGPPLPRTVTINLVVEGRREIGAGGTFVWNLGDTVTVDENCAREIMTDRVLQHEFECKPPFRAAAEPAQVPASDDEDDSEG